MEHGGIEAGGNKRVGLLIAVLALCLAVVETAAKSMQTEAISANVESNDIWTFYQARTIRETVVRTASDHAELLKAGSNEAGLRAIEARQKVWGDMAARWADDPKGGDGRKQLAERAHASEAKREHAFAKYHLYEFASAAFQVAIVVVSASIVTGVALLLWGGVLVAATGVGLAGLGLLAPHLIHL